jgi:hypothetical protein
LYDLLHLIESQKVKFQEIADMRVIPGIYGEEILKKPPDDGMPSVHTLGGFKQVLLWDCLTLTNTHSCAKALYPIRREKRSKIYVEKTLS